jgi:hypothetical protein
VSDPHAHYGLTAVFADVNHDGKLDLMVANDSTPNYLYLNKGNGVFEDASYVSGYALNENRRETASMGIAVGDYSQQRRARSLQHGLLRFTALRRGAQPVRAIDPTETGTDRLLFSPRALGFGRWRSYSRLPGTSVSF